MKNSNEDSPKIPPARPEIIAQIVALDCQLADLILKCQGNARELDELAGVLGGHLTSCEFDRDSLLLGVPDRHPQPAPPTMTDLPPDEQRLIFEAALFGAIGLETLRMLTYADAEFLMNNLSEGVNIAMADMTKEQITEALHKYVEMHNENLSRQVFRFHVQGKNN
jgi:hypothetical protein